MIRGRSSKRWCSKSNECNACRILFPSRNELFIHLHANPLIWANFMSVIGLEDVINVARRVPHSHIKKRNI